LNALNKHGCHLISLYAGAGKTILSIYLALKIRLKTLIICHRVELLKQWIEEIENTTEGLRCSIIKPLPSDNDKKKNPKQHDLNVDFLLVNPSNVPKLGEGIFKDVGCVIIDEIHRVMAESLSQSLFYVSPRYMIGLSATLYRPDGLDSLLDFYFGAGNRTVRELYHPHIVYKIQTEIEYKEDSSSQWSSLITSQCENNMRNDLIVNIIRFFKERYFMVLCQRVSQAEYIYGKLTDYGEKVSLYTGKTSGYDKNSRIIVSSLSKGGEGFSYKKLNSLIIASDCISLETEEYMIQYLARIMRAEDIEPIVFDIVDCHNTLKRHFSVRKRVYLKAGGIVRDFYKEFPQFDKI
jgi:superfamily II DNA or RNA helicase